MTSHILSITYQQAYLDAFEQGYTDVINTTITSVGSNMFEAAVFGKQQFYKEHPEAEGKMNITVLDSGTYTLGYGYPIVEASKMIKAGRSAEEITAWLDDFYATVEIIFAAYSLEYARKSGRIPAASAFVGDVLGLRPIISIVDGVTTVVEKVRGDRNVVPHIVDYAYGRAVDKKAPTAVICGSVEQYGEDIYKAVAKKFGHAPKARYLAGASIAINSGPKVAGVIVRRGKTDQHPGAGAGFHPGLRAPQALFAHVVCKNPQRKRQTLRHGCSKQGKWAKALAKCGLLH